MKNKLLTLLLAFPVILMAQNEHRSLVEGNSLYKEKDYVKSAAEYEKAIQVNKSSVKANYNLANSLYEKNNFEKAIGHYITAIENTDDDKIKAKAYHNLGNAYVRREQLKEACDAYKSSLRLNPGDVETKHNLAQTLKKIQPPPPPPPQQNPPDDGEKEEKPKDDIDRMMDMMENEDKKTQENKKNPPSRKRRPEKDW
jgi:Ca-activated chloride channel homolog